MVKIIISVLLFLSILFSCPNSQAQKPPETQAPAAVVHNGQRLFVYYANLDGIKPQERAALTAQIVRALAEDPKFDASKIQVREVPVGTAVTYGETVIVTASIEDAALAKDTTRHLAADCAGKLRVVLSKKVEELTAAKAAYAGGLTAATIFLLFITIAIICKLGSVLSDLLFRMKGRYIRTIRIQQAELINEEMLANLLVSVLQFSQIFLILLCAYFAALFILDSWPPTKELAAVIRETSWSPVLSALNEIVAYIPKLLVIAVIALLTHGALTFARFFFDAMEAGTIRFSGFDPDWARPTYTLTRLFFVALALVLALPYFPGWESDAFKQVGLLFGLLLSLGSTQVVGQVIGGTVLTYSNAFKVGECVKVGEHFGDIVEKTVFVTRMKTPKNEIVSLPNGQVIGSDIINYSRMAREGRLILHTSVTIGYDVPWRQVRDLLLKATTETEGILTDPLPFVLTKELGDFTVTYELNAHTDKANQIPATYSQLHQAILDNFNQAGVEIMSPRIFSLRDGNSPALPPENIPRGVTPKQFNVSLKNS